MFAQNPLPFIETYVEELEEALGQLRPQRKLSRTQKRWLKYCLMGILLTNKICWAKFEQAGLGGYRSSSLSWIFWWSKIPWEWLLVVSVRLLLAHHHIDSGTLVADDSGRKRAKITRQIFAAHKIYDTKSGGYFNGQKIILLLLVTPLVTFPVGFRFYRPDPVQLQWRKENQRLKNQGMKKSERPTQPAYDPNYPSYKQLVLEMLKTFCQHHSKVKVHALVADAQYGSATFMDQAAEIIGEGQIISQLRSNQNIRFRGREMKLHEYFTKYPASRFTSSIRGGREVTIMVNSARWYVSAHGCKRFVIALKYEGEEEYRYLIATEMSWRTLDIVRAYTLRWLIAVFFEDWK